MLSDTPLACKHPSCAPPRYTHNTSNIMPAKKGLYANIQAKRKRIAKGSREKMRKPGEEGAPTSKNFKQAKKTAKKPLRKTKAASSSGSKAAKWTTTKKSGAKKKSSTK